MTEDSRLGKPWLDKARDHAARAEEWNRSEVDTQVDATLSIAFALIGIGEVLGDLVTTTAAASLAREREAKAAATEAQSLRIAVGWHR